MRRDLLLISMIISAAVLAGFVAAQGNANDGCKNLYWFDNTNKSCGQQQFCGMYMYQGLQTFESKTLCEKALNETECVTDDDCPSLDCIGCTQYACKNWKCKELWGKCEVDSDCTQINCVMAPCPKIICINKKCETNKTCPQGATNENGTCTKLLSNGRKAEIKIMPSTASSTTIARLGDLGFNVTLKEVGQGNETKAVYEATADKEGKMLGLFKIKGKVSTQVDAETGEVVKVHKPWWAFMATGI